MAIKKMHRKVLAQLISPHLHIECVEVQADVWAPNHNEFFVDLRTVYEKALTALADNNVGGYGPWNEHPEDFAPVGVLCAVLAGLDRGRIVWAKQVEFAESRTPVFASEGEEG